MDEGINNGLWKHQRGPMKVKSGRWKEMRGAMVCESNEETRQKVAKNHMKCHWQGSFNATLGGKS